MRSAVPLGVPSFETAFVAGSEFSWPTCQTVPTGLRAEIFLSVFCRLRHCVTMRRWDAIWLQRSVSSHPRESD